MAALARAGWTVSAAGFLVLALSVLHTGHTGWFPALLLAFIVTVCAWRPLSGLEIVSAAVPLSWYLMERHWSASVSWAEVMACAAVAGLSIDAARRPRAARAAPAVAVPALLFGIVVCSAIVASLAVRLLTLGPAFWGAVAQEVARDYFIDLAEFPGLHAGLLLLEGVLLFALAARAAASKPAAALRIVRAVTIGATLAGIMNIARLIQAALRSDTVLSALSSLARTLRWNVEYGDYNAAGSVLRHGAVPGNRADSLGRAAAALVDGERHRDRDCPVADGQPRSLRRRRPRVRGRVGASLDGARAPPDHPGLRRRRSADRRRHARGVRVAAAGQPGIVRDGD